ncbi:MAG: ribonuclease H-like domain-containing protein [Candidatus Aenigmarchaeota archaeon]|nr:ribonuclease H-like domain-containing protein [Candidatus Aenigmarchaeota archaeon]
MKLIFQLLDVDYFLNGGKKPTIRLFGKTASGNAVCVFYDKFLPYFFIKPNDKTADALPAHREIVSAEKVEKFLPIGHQQAPTPLLKLTLTNPQDVPRIRDTFLENKSCDEVFEADILFKYRFMVDFNIHGMGWVEAECTIAPTKTVSVPAYHAETIAPVANEANTGLKYLALDIECLPTDTRRPLDPKNNTIIMIALSFEPAYRGQTSLVLVAKQLQGKETKGFQNEKEMLAEFLTIIDTYDPDIVTGYNINSFDLPYILDRLDAHRLPRTFGRVKDKPVFAKKIGLFQECGLPGRVVVDPYQILRRDPWIKFHRYNLNTVAKELLNEEKLDVVYSDIPKLWAGAREETSHLVEYARKDADLSLKLVIKKELLDKFLELSKISGLLLQDCFSGQATRVETMLMYEFKKRNFVMQARPSQHLVNQRTKEREKIGIKGATVLEPKKGLHAEGCTLVLDFRSLYPSIMRSFNISTDTLILNGQAASHTSPSGASFVTQEVREGIMPSVLTKLLDARSAAKKLMKSETGEKRKMLNARQLALKDISNSIYGYTGYVRARLYVMDVANSITAYGRQNIETTKKLIEDSFPVEVIYGDTDSLLMKTTITNPEEAYKLGNTISRKISDALPGYLELEFEKIYRTFLVLTKKRYAGWKFVFEGGVWKDDIEMKGIETIRRDWCPLVSETTKHVIDVILKEGDIQKAITSLREVLEKLKEGEIPLEKLTIVKGITRSLESYEGISPHIELARKLNTRNPSEPVKIGDRLGFVIIKGNQLLSKRAEDPEYVRKHNISIDSEYYIYSQLLPPIERILNAVGVSRSEVLGSGRQTNIMDILTGTKRKMKHTIDVTVRQPQSLNGWEGLVCKTCSKSYRRMPLAGACDCGGDLLISYHGSMGTKIIGN